MLLKHYSRYFRSDFTQHLIVSMGDYLNISLNMLWCVILLGSPSLTSCQESSALNVEIRGVYGNPKPLWDKGWKLAELGVNAIFVHSGSITTDMVTKAQANGLKVFAEYATLNGKDYVDQHPEAWAINAQGRQVSPAGWFMGVCPTEPGFRAYRIDQLRKLLVQFPLDGVWMDYVHWHAQFEEPVPILPETCFCPHCLEKFAHYLGVNIPGDSTDLKAAWILENHDVAWRDWRCLIVKEWVLQVKKIIKEVRPNALLGLFHCPWDDQEFAGARRRILGLDYDLLKDWVDVFSPMVYHGRMGRKPEWVGDNIRWFCDRLGIKDNIGPKVWPIVQAYDDPYAISAKEFEMVLRGGMSGQASGVMMFTTYAIAIDTSKMAAMRTVYEEVQR